MFQCDISQSIFKYWMFYNPQINKCHNCYRWVILLKTDKYELLYVTEDDCVSADEAYLLYVDEA